MVCEETHGEVGCLCIDGIESLWNASESRLPGIAGVSPLLFRWNVAGDVWGALQSALQHLRRRHAVVAVAARGTGCCAALALAEQLPVDRLALIEPALRLPAPPRALCDGSAAAWRQARRLTAYARRNLCLCVSDALVLESRGGSAFDALRAGGCFRHCRSCRLRLPSADGANGGIIRDREALFALSDFLRTGELPKSLAENAEMCIIYG